MIPLRICNGMESEEHKQKPEAITLHGDGSMSCRVGVRVVNFVVLHELRVTQKGTQ